MNKYLKITTKTYDNFNREFSNRELLINKETIAYIGKNETLDSFSEDSYCLAFVSGKVVEISKENYEQLEKELLWTNTK